ncbi:hypothetical protein DL93DRAFT_2088137 [Clavulina sp. PMI_390]|nr:hypothetical protein DL93DRAFT_2088137 [Clavulina sp. PMI_390]
MTLDAAVFTGVEVHPPSTRHPNIPPRAWAYVRKIDALDESRISYWPRERWTMWQDGLAETSTTFHPERIAEYPQLSFSFSGHAVHIFGPPRSWLPLPAGGLEVCVDGSCDFVDARHIYLTQPPAMATEVRPTSHSRAINAASSLDTGNARDPVLLWSRNDLDYNRQHKVSVTLVAEDPPLDMGHGDVREGFVLHHVSYTEVIVPWELPEWLTFQIDLSDISEIVLAVLQTIALIIAVAIYLPLFLYTLVVIIYLIVSIWRFTIRAISSIFTRPASSRPTSPGEGEPFNQHSRDHHRHDNDHSHQHNYYGSTTDNFAQNQRAAGHGRDGSAPPYSPSGPPPYYRRQDPRPPSYSTATNNNRTNGDGR